jgi:hypothetical protein
MGVFFFAQPKHIDLQIATIKYYVWTDKFIDIFTVTDASR